MKVFHSNVCQPTSKCPSLMWDPLLINEIRNKRSLLQRLPSKAWMTARVLVKFWTVNEIVFVIYWNVWSSELLYFNNPVIRNVSLLASLYLRLQSWHLNRRISFFLNRRISDWATWNADNAVVPSAGRNMFFEFFPKRSSEKIMKT